MLGPSLTVCPSCRRLAHKEKLEELAAAAALASGEGRVEDALRAWRDALPLLPEDARQADVIRERIDELVRLPASSTGHAARGIAAKAAGAVGGLAVLALKLKWVLAFVFTQGKLALFGLTKIVTLVSMLASFALYWNLFGWPFALGLVASIYIHELGHVAALRHLAIPVDAPMFVPGFGAFVRLRQRPASPKEDASVALAGPEAGLLAALVSAVLYAITGLPVFGAVARTGAWINLFNLLPVGPLDGGRALRALSRAHRIVLAVVMLVTLLVTRESMLVLLVIVLAARVLDTEPPRRRHAHLPALARFAFLVIALSAISSLAAPPEANLERAAPQSR